MEFWQFQQFQDNVPVHNDSKTKRTSKNKLKTNQKSLSKLSIKDIIFK
jgi:hypothetical protein